MIFYHFHAISNVTDSPCSYRTAVCLIDYVRKVNIRLVITMIYYLHLKIFQENMSVLPTRVLPWIKLGTFLPSNNSILNVVSENRWVEISDNLRGKLNKCSDNHHTISGKWFLRKKNVVYGRNTTDANCWQDRPGETILWSQSFLNMVLIFICPSLPFCIKTLI